MLYSNFVDINNFANFRLIKCYHLLLNLKNVFKNYANYLIVIILIINIISIFIFSCHDYLNIKKTINLISGTIENRKNVNVNQNNNQRRRGITNIITNINQINDNDTNKNNFGSRIRFKDSSLNNKKKNNQTGIIQLNNKKNKKIKKIKKNLPRSSNKNLIRGMKKSTFSVLHNDINVSDKKGEKEEDEKYTYTDYELNSLEYKEALKIDKRTYTQFYLSLIRTKHLLIFTFCNNKDYNSKIIKIYIFFLNFMINYTINAMFYSETLMHRIYVESGKFNFVNQLPEMIYSSIIETIINAIIEELGLCQDNIIDIKKSNKENIEKNKKQELKKIKCKIIFFFIINYLLLFFCWIYLGCFCAVYKNTQVHLLKEVLSSFVTSLIMPFLINIFPGMFRIPGLKMKKSCLYKLSKILQII